MRFLTFVFAMVLGQAAYAHPGHLAEVAGHGHWLGAAAIGAAIAIGLWAGRKQKAGKAQEEKAAEDDEELQEA